jgi:hypothetical protein
MMHLERRGDSLHYTIKLTTARDFFVAPDPDPFVETPMYMSGIDYLLDELKPRGLDSPLHLTVSLPTAEPITVDEMRRALQNFCKQKVNEAERDLGNGRWLAFKTLQTGLIFLGICLVLSSFSRDAEFLPQFLRDFLSEGWLIGGWVALWRPTELFLYDWWPAWRSRRLYTYLPQATLEIEHY